MSFLVPLFLAGLGALALPILLHVRRQIPKERFPFSAVMFLDEAAPRTKRRMRLQDLLLLLLRCLGLALLAFAFARPFFGSDSILAKTPPVEHLVLVDTSASMRGERFEEARQEAAAIVERAGADDTIAVATFDRALSIKLSFEASQKLPPGERRTAALAAIKTLEPGWFDTNLGALNSAADLADQARSSAETPIEVSVISDFQRGASTSDLTGADWPHLTRIVPIFIRGDAWTNAGVHPLESRQNPGQVRVINSAGSENDAFTITVPGQPPKSIDVPPGQSQLVSLKASGTTARYDLTGDPFDFDNHAWTIPPSKTAIGVDYFGPATAEDSKDTLFFLSRALQANGNYTIDLRVRPSDSPNNPALTILDGSAETVVARQRLETGGNILLLLRDASDAKTIAELTGSPVSGEEAPGGDPALFGNIDFKNPIFQPFADPRFSNFTHIYTWHHRKIDLSKLPAAQTLATFSSGDAALFGVPVGRGILYVLTTTWRPADSQLALSTKFVPLLHAMLKQSAGLVDRGTQVWIGDEVQLPPNAEQRVELPDGSFLPADKGLFSATTMPGIYQTTDALYSFAVNLRPTESEITPFAMEDLRTMGLPLNEITPSKTGEEQRRAMAAEELERNQKWWWWLIAAALGIFILESGLAAWTTKRRSTAAVAA